MKITRKLLFASLFLFLVLMVACADEEAGGDTDQSDQTETETEQEASNDDDKSASSGGELKVAINAQPPTMDPQMTTATATRDVARLVFESLLVLNDDFEPVPFLAEEVEVDNNQTFTFHLREGVKFHNGEEMKAEDVVASMNRWKENENKAQQVIGESEFEEVDEYTVTIELSEPSSLALGVMATPGQFAAIMPKDINESAGADGVTEYIGTGPFEFEDWKQDNYIQLSKFDDYEPLDEPADGLAGKREALVDEVYFYIAPDASTRLAGIQSGEYDIAYQLPFDNYQQLLETDLQVEPSLAGDMILQYNTREGLMADDKVRQAVNAALNIDDILTASLVEPEIYSAGANLMEEDNVQWYTTAGEENYNVNDLDLAEQLLEESSYDGETVKIVSTRDYQHYYDSSVVIQEQLQKIGMDVDLEVYDWPTLTELVKDDSAWHMRVNGFTFKADPTQILYLDSSYNGVRDDEQLEAGMKAIEVAETEEEAREAWESLQEYVWTDFLPMTKLGSYSHLYVLAEDVEGFVYSNGSLYWNVSKQ